VDYLFLQVFVDQALVSYAQGCGNILSGVVPAAIERGLVKASGEITPVRIHMFNSGDFGLALVVDLTVRRLDPGNGNIAGVEHM
ncbi:PrpF domain-containing protein, partial [Rhizobium johnstonii]